ncbi:hypothetical protein ANN_03819 [Periplaneta americana]|uniref:Mariner Mos1 transposase n=1 Tax=Periplaneta americana TaxID=6978 RepID=A0ABQ8U4M5_PERAM|nr:hypothetical protein ANN_03819 [Periplaneta americana]
MELLEDILFIDSNFKIVSKSITLLESSKLQLSKALNIVDKVSQIVIQNITNFRKSEMIQDLLYRSILLSVYIRGILDPLHVPYSYSLYRERSKPYDSRGNSTKSIYNYFKWQSLYPDRSRLVPVAWQQWSEMEALIPSPAACEVRSVIKFFNAQSIAPIEIHRYHDDGDEFLDRIVTGDETWISHFTPETKQQSMHWRHSGSPVRTKFKQTLSVRKVMCTVFWDRKGILLIDFLPRGETVNADRYCETVRKLRRAIQNKRRGMLSAGVVLLHDNSRPHTARRTAAVLTEFGWELFDDPPYSPDLAPSDFHVFLHLKKFLSSGERFGNDEELKTSVTRWFHLQAAEFYDRGIQKTFNIILQTDLACWPAEIDGLEKFRIGFFEVFPSSLTEAGNTHVPIGHRAVLKPKNG